MAARLGDLLAMIAGDAIAARGRFEMAVSGGSTPEALYRYFAGKTLPWSSVHLTLVDERWVSADHPRSNETFVKNAFSHAEGVQIHGLYRDRTKPSRAAAAVENDLADRGEFDCVILGMGDDGHTASWFPHADGLNEALSGEAKAFAVTAQKSAVTGDETERMTLGLRAVEKARLIILLLAGDGKRAAFVKALEDGPVEAMPVRAILRARPDLWVCWAP